MLLRFIQSENHWIWVSALFWKKTRQKLQSCPRSETSECARASFLWLQRHSKRCWTRRPFPDRFFGLWGKSGSSKCQQLLGYIRNVIRLIQHCCIVFIKRLERSMNRLGASARAHFSVPLSFQNSGFPSHDANLSLHTHKLPSPSAPTSWPAFGFGSKTFDKLSSDGKDWEKKKKKMALRVNVLIVYRDLSKVEPSCKKTRSKCRKQSKIIEDSRGEGRPLSSRKSRWPIGKFRCAFPLSHHFEQLSCFGERKSGHARLVQRMQKYFRNLHVARWKRLSLNSKLIVCLAFRLFSDFASAEKFSLRSCRRNEMLFHNN